MLGINLGRNVQNMNKTIKHYLKIQKEGHYSLGDSTSRGRFMLSCFKLNTIPIKTPMSCFMKIEKLNLKLK